MSGVVTAHDIPWTSTNQECTPQTISRPPLRDVLNDVTFFLRRYVVMTDAQATAVALWAAHTHLVVAAECTPYLQVTSATKRAGKTRLLEALEPLVARPWLTGRTSAAVLVRKTDAEHPTLLLDESDAAFNGEKEYSEALRGILNTGYRKSGKASLCIGQGANLTYKDFSTFSPKAIAGIGELPGTIADRSICIALQRRRQDEPCARWRERRGHEEAKPLFEALVGLARLDVLVQLLEDAKPELPAALGDRQADVWEPLLAIADAAGDDWAKRARQAALELSGSVEDTDRVVELLTDIRDILTDETAAVIPTKDILAALLALEDRPWQTWKKGKPLNGHSLARLLRPLGIHPKGLEHVRGYRRDAFMDAITRYLPFKASERQELNKDGPEVPFLKRQDAEPADGPKTAISPINTGLTDALTLQTRLARKSLTDEAWARSDALFRKGWQ